MSMNTQELQPTTFIHSSITTSYMYPHITQNIMKGSKGEKKTTPTYFSCEVFQNSGRVYSGCGTDAAMARRSVLQMSVNTTDWELQKERKINVT